MLKGLKVKDRRNQLNEITIEHISSGGLNPKLSSKVYY